MASSDSEHSIAGISIPQWMKNKINDRYDLDQSTFSPPTDDDSFFYIRYPKTESSGQHQLQNDNHHSSDYRSLRDVIENHTLPCQDFIPAAKATPWELGMKRGVLDPPLGVPKSAGTDDGFHSSAAACGKSVIAVAHQMIAGGKLLRSPPMTDSEDEGPATPPAAHMIARRRPSRSLPSSPLTSPKSLRKNPYFTTGILGSSDDLAQQQGRDTRTKWLSSYMKDTNMRNSLGEIKIPEETTATSPQKVEPVIVRAKTVAKPKPSQLREMNFWSPTSM